MDSQCSLIRCLFGWNHSGCNVDELLNPKNIRSSIHPLTHHVCKYISLGFCFKQRRGYSKFLSPTIRIPQDLAYRLGRRKVWLNAIIRFIFSSIFSCLQALLAILTKIGECTQGFSIVMVNFRDSKGLRTISLMNLGLQPLLSMTLSHTFAAF